MKSWRQTAAAVSAPWQVLSTGSGDISIPCPYFLSTLFQRMTVAIMASVDTIGIKHALENSDYLPRKRFKTSELPLNATQKSTIDGLVHTIKKKGEYDSLRKNVWSQFESVCRSQSPKAALIDRICLLTASALGGEDGVHRSIEGACRSRD